MDMSAVITARSPPLDAKRWWHTAPAAYTFFVASAILLILPSLFGPTMLYDSFWISWVWADQFTGEIARGNLYPRWLPLSNSGLGSSVFYYYPPLAFYVAAAFGLLGLTTYASLISAFGASFALSGITAWHWLKERSAHPVIGALMYMAAPYHLFDYTRRGALAESVAIALIPLVALGLRRVVDGRGTLLASFAYAAIILTHLPLALLTSVLLVAPYALRHWRKLPAVAAAVALGICLSAIYLLPALALDRFRDTAMLYREDFLNPAYWLLWNADFSNGFILALFLIIAALSAMALILVAVRRDRWAFGALFVLMISVGLVPGFWSLPLIWKVQFPYRALPIAEFALVTAMARTQFKPLILAGLLPLTLLSVTFLRQANTTQPLGLGELQGMHPDLPEYLPKGVIAIDDRKPSPRDVGQIVLPPPQVPGKVVEPVFYFPAWSCGEMHPQTKLLMHEPSCRPRIVWTREEWIGAIISLLGLLVAGALAFRSGAATACATRSLGAIWACDRVAMPPLPRQG